MSDGTNPAPTPIPAPPTDPASGDPKPADDRPEWAKDLTKAVEDLGGRVGLLGKDLGKVRERVKKGEPKPPTEDPKPTEPATGASAEVPEWAAELQREVFETRLKALPKDSREKLSKELADGDLSVMEAIQRAKLISSYVPATVDDTPTPKGKPATGARNQGQQFTSWEQWSKFRSERPADAHAHMQANPTFAPSKLPGGPRHGR